MTGRSRLPEPPRSGPLTVLAEQTLTPPAEERAFLEIEAALAEAPAGRGLVAIVPGVRDLDALETIAGLSLLGRVARRIPPERARLLVPVAAPLVLRAAARILGNRAGARVVFVSGDAFGFAAGAAELIRRERPDAVFFAGAFSGESMILVAAAHEAGARSVGGTARLAAAPVFRIGCDCALVGEALFSAAGTGWGEAGRRAATRVREGLRIAAAGALLLGALLATLGSEPAARAARVLGTLVARALRLGAP